MIANMTLGAKVSAAFAAMAVIILGMGAFCGVSLKILNNMQDGLSGREAKKIELSGWLDMATERMKSEMNGFILATVNKDAPAAAAADRTFHETAGQAQKAVGEVLALAGNQRERQAAETIQTGIASWLEVYQEIARHCAAGQASEASRIRTAKALPIADKMDNATDELLESARNAFAGTDRSFDQTNTRARWTCILLTAFCLVIGVAVLVVVRRATGSLRSMAAELSSSAGQVASAANQVASAGQSLATSAAQQAASLEQTSASSEQINSMARRNSDNSRAVADLASASQQKIGQTNQSLEEMVTAMGEINASGGKISRIIKVIEEIAFQTNILALNAAVEAARAGEAGMGFAVVADEVRSLAQRCAQAAQDTTSLIEDSVAKSGSGQTKLDEVAGGIRAITEDSGKVKSLADEVNLGSQEQSRGIEQVAKSIAQMEQLTQRTAANAEESASAAQELRAQSEALNGIVRNLTAIVGAA